MKVSAQIESRRGKIQQRRVKDEKDRSREKALKM
jgi:hypothetical protein